jgi:hypothetical protein
MQQVIRHLKPWLYSAMFKSWRSPRMMCNRAGTRLYQKVQRGSYLV